MIKYTPTDKKDTRSGFGAGLLELGKKNNQVVALCADLTGSLKMDAFAKEFPDRFFQVGIAEANMMGIAVKNVIAPLLERSMENQVTSTIHSRPTPKKSVRAVTKEPFFYV
jgi:hypothetical protein